MSNDELIRKQNFSSETLGQARLTWSHECHKWFEEVCAIYLLRSRVPYAKSLSNIRSHLDSACFRSYCLYALYGPNDFIAIAWGHPQKHELLLDIFRADGHLEVAKQLEVQNVIHGDNRRHVPFADNVQWSREIEKFYRMENGGLEAEKFRRSGLIWEYTELTEPVFKFFVVLEPTFPPVSGGARPRAVDVITLLDPLRDIISSSPEMQLTFYEGKGEDYVIEATARRYDLVFDTLQSLAKTWMRGQLRPQTSLVASRKVIECDDIDTEWAPLTSDERKLVEFLELPEAVTSFLALSRENRALVVWLYRKFVLDLTDSPLTKSPFQGAFRDMLSARVFNRSRYLVSALPIVHELEGYLSLVIKRIWIEELGDEWVHEVTRVGTAMDESFSVRSFSLAAAIHVSNKICLVRKRLDEELGKDWLRRVDGVREYRNRFAHGDIAIDEAYLEDKWLELAVAVLDVGVVFNRVVALYEEMTDKEYERK